MYNELHGIIYNVIIQYLFTRNAFMTSRLQISLNKVISCELSLPLIFAIAGGAVHIYSNIARCLEYSEFIFNLLSSRCGDSVISVDISA